MIFNGIEKDYLITLHGRRRSAWAPVSRNLITVPGMAGAYLSRTDIQARVITVPVLVKAENISDLQKIKEDMAEWLIHDEPKELIFKDEPDRVYYALVDGELELDEIFSTGQGEITFICPDPYKYGDEVIVEFPSNVVTVTNEGTTEADPVFELEVLEPVTFAMIQNQDEDYMMIGRPVDVDDVVYTRLTTILNDNCSSLVGWTHLPNGATLDTGIVGGTMTVRGGYAFTPESYGTNPNGWVGPAIRRSLSEQVQDFQCEIRIGAFNTYGEVGSIELHLLDENDNTVAVMAMRDSTTREENRAVIQLGQEGNRYFLLNYNGGYRATWNDFSGVIRLEREGNAFQARVAMVDSDTGMHYRRHNTPVFYDTLGNYQAPIAQIVVYIAKAKDYEPYDMLMNNIYVGRINQEIGVPYIADAGDIITFDHVNEDILLNGESRKDLKDFGAKFFKLKRGDNQLAIHPDAFNASLRYRTRFK